MIVKLLTEQHLEFISLRGGCLGSPESIHVKMPHCSKLHVTAQVLLPTASINIHGLSIKFLFKRQSIFFFNWTMSMK